MDPLVCLPPELVLKIIEYTELRDVGTLARVSFNWLVFIQDNDEQIYAAKADHPQSMKDPADYSDNAKSFTKYYDGVRSWKELCRRQTLLKKNWNGAHTETKTRESIVQIGINPVWRFRPDFQRRFILSSSQRGGIIVTCMETGLCLWSLPSHQVRPYAHLEYAEDLSGHAVAVWDTWNNGIEVWKSTEEDGGERGMFEKVALIQHDVETRGYQLSYNTLCVVAREGKGFVYDMLQTPPALVTQHHIGETPVGHLDQNEDCVMYCLGEYGYHIYSKATGDFLGAIEPWTCSSTNVYRITHPKSEPNEFSYADDITRRLMHGPTPKPFPPMQHTTKRLVPLLIARAPPLGQPSRSALSPRAILREDEWGAGMFHGSLMVGVSRHGRIVVVRNWCESLCRATRNDTANPSGVQAGGSSQPVETETQRAAAAAFATNADLIFCSPHESSSHFDLGGWLSVRDNRIACEIRDRIYMIALNRDGTVPPSDTLPERKSYAIASASAPAMRTPVSFMALFDDCFMHTYTTLGRGGSLPMKMVRTISFAPDLDEMETKTPAAAEQSAADSGERERAARAAERSVWDFGGYRIF